MGQPGLGCPTLLHVVAKVQAQAAQTFREHVGIHSHAASIDDAEAMLRRVFVRGSGAPPARPHNVDGSQHHFAERGRAVEKSNLPTEGTAPLVETEGLSFSYPLGPRVLDEIEVRIRPGEFVAILIPAVAVVLGAPIALTGLGVAQPVAAPISLALALATYFTAAAVIDRRARA